MAVTRTETAKKFLAKEIEKLSDQERQVVERFINRGRIARNVAHEFEEQLTAGQRVADHIAEIIGSWRFIIIQSMLLAVWVALNITAYIYRWDPYSFILLNLALSFQAAYSAPIIMMSQNRAGEKDRLAAEIDHEVNVKAEVKIGLIMNRLDDLERSMHFLHDEQRTMLKQLASNNS